MTARKLFALVLLGGLLLLLLAGCTAKYRLDYDGQKNAYFGAQEEYKVGDAVDLYYMFIAVDTDYTFYLDNEVLPSEPVEGKGIHLRFEMPAHDAVLRCEAKSTAADNPYPAGELLVDFYYEANGGSGYDELILYGYSSQEATLCVYEGTVNGDETRTDYLIPVSLVDQCFSLIRECKLESWESLTAPTALEGTSIICKYRKNADNYVRASTEMMPEDGEQTLMKIYEFLLSCVKPEYII